MSLLIDRFKNVWNAFTGRDPTYRTFEPSYSYRPDQKRFHTSSLRTVVAAIYNQIAVDCSVFDINHVRLGENGRYEDTINSSLNRALTLSANEDQTGRELIRESVSVMLDEGYVAIAPVSTSANPNNTESYEIYELRVGKITEWRPTSVRIELYDERDGQTKSIILDKRYVVIVENPFYGIMNEPNSTAKRLIRTLNQLDQYNDNTCAGKMDLIIQLPYVIKTEARRAQAEQRRKDIEAQLTGSKYGIAYTDGTERIVQLNRSLENNLWTQAKDLQEQLYNQLGFSKAIFDGTATEQETLNYNSRTIEPILSAITEEMERKWISRTAQTQGQAIRFFRNPFKLIPVAQLAEMADKLTRNEIMTSNEIRAIIGMKPFNDPRADELRNANLNHPDEKEEVVARDENIQNEEE